MSFWGRRKALDALTHVDPSRQLKRTLSWPHLVALGIGAIIGTGIYTLTGIGAERAGPAVILAFAACGILCVFAALTYTEMATLMPAAGSAYTYTYSVLGEGLAWLVGWSLILEYAVTCSAVAVGWSGYMVGLLESLGVHLPAWMISGPHGGGIINLPAVLITLAVTAMLARGAKESATLNIVLVAIKLLALAVFVGLTAPAIMPENFTPFMPYGFASHSVDGQVRGVMAAAAIVFFAFFGFDAVSTSAEEVKNPERDLTIGIIGSMVVCTLIYMIVAACAVGAWPFAEFAASGEPLAFILRGLEHPGAAFGIGAAAIIALPSVILVMMFGQTRVFFVMARDGLLPRSLSQLDAQRRGPLRLTFLVGGFVALVAGFFRLDQIAELSNAGTLTAFIAVSVCVMVLRRTRPDLPRLFRCPAVWIVAPLAVIGCLYFMISLPTGTLVRFAIWNLIGVGVYLAYGRRRSLLAQAGS
ncbi:amino acid permease [Niveispirillum cyanobacteriorum]|uniref:Amino acid permease n=1 Tax=Niveispirillum cyanobacteriorum TaxID=1612173 RepID=A0A2K9NIJ5_9PROT|nr:amino acid permease [Niveispirillum cyanobacteriorum]AUN32406.1 amino acid permease [Niveispirillum cyanobacteriorum]GGE78668.1 amino acid transporter [Niveispirillum cyanobacteriorum]